ncbi:hypothetical protein TNCV_2539581 [Trichonephila clavipes]|nr:hypothetical protein TNCV_2539581 [Trichonephila clavipes]
MAAEVAGGATTACRWMRQSACADITLTPPKPLKLIIFPCYRYLFPCQCTVDASRAWVLMDVCKCTEPSRHEGTLNRRRAASPLVRLMAGEERRKARDPPPGSPPGGAAADQLLYNSINRQIANIFTKNDVYLALRQHFAMFLLNRHYNVGALTFPRKKTWRSVRPPKEISPQTLKLPDPYASLARMCHG